MVVDLGSGDEPSDSNLWSSSGGQGITSRRGQLWFVFLPAKTHPKIDQPLLQPQVLRVRSEGRSSFHRK